MDLEYQFQLVFLRLVLKRNVVSESTLRITLLQTSKQVQPSSTAFQTEEMRIRKNQKIVDLESMRAFSFRARREHGDNKFIIKYEIKGNSEERVRSLPVHAARMIAEFLASRKAVFEETFAGENAEISYKFYLTAREPDLEVFKLLVTPEPRTMETVEEAGNETRRSNSISRSKRPPNLNINKRTSPSPPPSQGESSDQPTAKHPLKHFPNALGSLLALSPASPDNKMPFLALNNLESHDQNSSISGTHKKISSLPLSEIEKVNELMATHHRPQVEEHHALYLSYKLKIVIVMFIIGIAFLIFDTFSDRKSYNKSKKVQKIDAVTHDGHDGHGKGQKSSKAKPPKKQGARVEGGKKSEGGRKGEKAEGRRGGARVRGE